MLTTDELLRVYDDQLRGEADVISALRRERYGPLVWATYGGGRGFVSYRTLGDGIDAAEVERLVDVTCRHYKSDPAIRRVEWKTRGHDHAPGLHDALIARGFMPADEESVMMGDADGLAVHVALPPGVTLRRITEPDDVLAMETMAAEVFAEGDPAEYADALIRRLAAGKDDLEIWVAERNPSSWLRQSWFMRSV